MSKAKYEAAAQIRSIAQFEADPAVWFKLRGKTVHRSFLISLQYRTLKLFIDAGQLYNAKEKAE